MTDREWLTAKAAIVDWWPEHSRLAISANDEPSTLDTWRPRLESFDGQAVTDGIILLAESGETLRRPLDLPLVMAYVAKAAERRRMLERATIAKLAEPTPTRSADVATAERLRRFDETAIETRTRAKREAIQYAARQGLPDEWIGSTCAQIDVVGPIERLAREKIANSDREEAS